MTGDDDRHEPGGYGGDVSERQRENREALTSVPTYHVFPREVTT